MNLYLITSSQTIKRVELKDNYPKSIKDVDIDIKNSNEKSTIYLISGDIYLITGSTLRVFDYKMEIMKWEQDFGHEVISSSIKYNDTSFQG